VQDQQILVAVVAVHEMAQTEDLVDLVALE
jgi:hypothetical protein